MNQKSGNGIQVTISYAVFILSGFLIFSPLHKSCNLPLSLLCSIAVSSLLFFLILTLISKRNKSAKPHVFISYVSAITVPITSLFASLMLLTEIIKDVAYIANRGVSLYYYTFIAFIILFVSYYLCTSSENAVYRFTVLAFFPFIILFFVMFLSLFTTKSIINDFQSGKSSLLSSVLTGVRSGIFFTVDSSAFFICFGKQIKLTTDKFPKKELTLGFITAYTFIIIYNILTVLIFGQLTSKITDPDYALIKLIGGIDFTEIISTVRIISFLIKSCIYIYLSGKVIKDIFPRLKISGRTLTGLLYLAIPLTFLCLAFFDSSLKYGAFQHLIYPVTAIMSVCFIIIYKLNQKKND